MSDVVFAEYWKICEFCMSVQSRPMDDKIVLFILSSMTLIATVVDTNRSFVDNSFDHNDFEHIDVNITPTMVSASLLEH